jgi:hypothetical protein
MELGIHINLFCGPQAASERLQKLEDMGYDDVLLVKRNSKRRVSLYEDDFNEDDLRALRNLLRRESPQLAGSAGS